MEKYRMIKANEVIRITDEVYVGDPINKWLMGSLNTGKKLPKKYVGKYRRLCKPKHKKLVIPQCLKIKKCNYHIPGYCGGENSNHVDQFNCYTI